ncbi:hypothetical protein QVD17_29919 [Tagetes erecta]|uniref:non-specific serine/threonine protein kinase n=1 Tax=Tagetes erecta TaxID=13708 RepID=A0AAD8K1T5_TARER|nr:hypothetical protein QVD17_29919 [Tagetes erecta]
MSISSIQNVGSSSSSSSSPQLCRQFTFSEIKLATQNLDESLVIGRGGFGKVYKGTIINGNNLLIVAIKRLGATSNQGAQEFWTEVNMLSNLRHCHLVSLIGYCNDEEEFILVYEYMAYGTLEDHLHRYRTPLSWVQRLTICIGAARGLDYLHTGTGIKHGVVHRDVKSSNILLHDNWVAKISDFGLSKICPKNQQTTHVSTKVKGTFGYLDPDYFYTGKLTRKSDVYSFGVVLFEVLCGKRAVDRSTDEDQSALVVWALDSIKEGKLKEVVDTNILGGISLRCLKVFVKLAKQCLSKKPKQRPLMSEVVTSLESILALQANANNTLQPAGMKYFARQALKVILPYDKNSGIRNQTLHQFDFDTINVATENFSEANVIPQLKTYASLYKGKLQSGQRITVSRNHYSSRYDILMNEASILVKLEHENLAKLLGYCIAGTTLFLVYDLELHVTSDYLMFDPVCTSLNWDKRFKIILGVARALLYLHRDAPIRIIHGDVKPGNILLDENLKPILSGFLELRYLDTNQIQYIGSMLSTPRHYKSPGYTCYANVSTKEDVYSLGVLLLEALTKRSMSTYLSLHEYVVIWLEGKLPNTIDPRLQAYSSCSVTNIFEIGLLCVQEDATVRPTMEEVVSMLLGKYVSLNFPVSKMRERMTQECSGGNFVYTV